jgi:hypothetical protein
MWQEQDNCSLAWGDVLEFDPTRVLANARQSGTEDLLDRVTAYRAGMDPQAIPIIEQELRSRGIGAEAIQARLEQCRREHLMLADGTAAKCHFCYRPAVVRAWGWQRLWRRLPIFPRPFYYCKAHQPAAPAQSSGAASAQPHLNDNLSASADD